MKKSNNLFTQIVDALVSDGFIIVENALESDLPKELLTTAQNINTFTQAGISQSSNQHIDNNKRRDKIKWLDEDNASQSEYLKFTNTLKETLNQELYMGIKYYESHFSIYDEGDFYEKHLDAFKGNKNRVVTTVYYLNNEWDKKDGGELIIYDEEHRHLTTVSPKANTLVVFLSDKFPHEVLVAKKRRFSIAGWFRIDK
ncbi:2OG-Fe(II) oxygenase [Sulfurimonas sp.]|nr:2OG-Fe(II) oxygenase [Sulfurimonas sp.]